MKKIYPLIIFCIIAVVIVAFSPTKNDDDGPAYQTAKKNFRDAYLLYKTNLDNGIRTEPPVDPTGRFRIDENGNMNLISKTFNPTDGIPGSNPDVVNNYVFTQSTGTYTAINGTGTLVAGSGNCDDATFGTFPIGFTFTYNGIAYTTFGCTCNGSVSLGAVPDGSYTPLSTGGTNNIVAPFAYDLQLNTDGAIYYQTTGSAPNRVCTIEFYHQGFWPTSGNELSCQVKFVETSNAVQFMYTTGSHTSTASVQVGLRGASNADFINRTTTTSWAATTAGGVNSATCSFSPTIFPAAGLTFQWAPPAPPPVPGHLTPGNHSVGNPQTVLISWGVSSGATNYHLQIATDSLMTVLAFSDTTLTGTAYNVGVFPPLTSWWWRVRAKNAVGWSAFDTSWTFKIMGPATQPTLLTPVNNATNQPTALTCVWARASDQTTPRLIISPPFSVTISNYWYELSTDTTGVPLIRDSTLTDTTRAVTGLLNNTNYWWRVKAKNQVGWGPFSVYFKFTTVIAAPGPPTLISPPNNALGIGLTPMLDWSSVATATSYRVQLSTDSTYATTQLDTTVSADSVQVPAGRLVNNTLYYWHVRAANIGGNSAYTGNFKFTTSLVGITGNGEIPKVFKLYQAYPNPFNPSSTIKFDIPNASDVKLVIYNAIGEQISVLVNEHYNAGSYSVVWDATNFPSGVYFYRIYAGNSVDIHKMVLLK